MSHIEFQYLQQLIWKEIDLALACLYHTDLFNAGVTTLCGGQKKCLKILAGMKRDPERHDGKI